MINTNEFYFTAADGTDRIYVKEWIPQDEPSAILIIAHGMGEHVERYSEFANFMAEYGVLTAGPDGLGHGRSVKDTDDLGFFAEENGWQQMVDNLHILQTMEQDARPGVPIFFFGYDMGAAMVRCYMMDYCDELSGAILCGTGDLPESAIRGAMALAAVEEKRFGPRHRSAALERLWYGSFNRKFAPNRTKFDWLTRDDAVVDAYSDDPCCSFVPTVSAFKDMFRGMLKAQNHRNQAKIMPNLPVFIFGGEMDPMGSDGKGIQKAAHAMRDAGVLKLTVKLYADGRHDMLHELNRGQVYSDILTWIGNRV